MNNARLISADIGSGYTQVTDGMAMENFKSIVCPMPGWDDRGFGSEDLETIGYNGMCYIVGKEAVSFGKKEERLDTLQNDWGGSTGWMVLLCAALGRIGVRDGDTVTLVTGLPQGLYKKRRADLERLLKASLSFVYRGLSIEVKVRPLIVPQATGALYYQVNTDPFLLRDEVGVIDIGTYTTGLAVAYEGVLTDHKCGGVPVGVSQLSESVHSYLHQHFAGLKMDLAIMPNLLMERTMMYRGERIDIGNIIDNEARSVVKPMLDTISEKWSGGADMRVYLAGGGAPFFEKCIIDRIPHAKMMEDPFNAVCVGMRYLLGQIVEANEKKKAS